MASDAPAAQDEAGYEPFIVAEGWREDTSIRFVPQSAVADAVKAEREACARLAEQHKVTYQQRKSCNCGRIHPGTGEPCTYTVGPPLPFAGLIRARNTPDGAEATGEGT